MMANDKINVLLVIDHLAYDGHMHGAGAVFSNIISRIDKKRFRVAGCVLRRPDSIKTACEQRGLRVEYLGRRRFDPFTVVDLVRLIKREKIDLLHLHQYGSSIFGRVAGIIMRVPNVLHGHGIDYAYSWYQQVLDWCLAKFTDRAIVVSGAVKDVYVRKRKLAGEKVTLLPNGIPLGDFQSPSVDKRMRMRREFGIQEDEYVVGTITRLRAEKGNRYLLEAAAEVLKVLPNTWLLLVGDGPLLTELVEAARDLGINKKVIFTGFREDVMGILSMLDVMVVASITEGHPLVIVEAMSMGKAIIATRVDGIAEVLMDGETGLLVPPKDPRTMADKIIYLLQNEEARTRLGAKARQESHKYSLEVYVQQLQTLYEELVASSRGRAGRRSGAQGTHFE